MQPIIINFAPSIIGRIEFFAGVMTGDRLSFRSVGFKLDTGSDFTTINCKDLINLGYTEQTLRLCKSYGKAYTASAGEIKLQYLENISIKFGDREIQGCRIYFALNSNLRSFFGSDILKYFNIEINNDAGELRLNIRNTTPRLSEKEPQLHIYMLE